MPYPICQTSTTCGGPPSSPNAARSATYAPTSMPVTREPPRSSGTRSGSRWFTAASTRSRELIAMRSPPRNPLRGTPPPPAADARPPP
ncbi:MAG: hypothetical protein WCG34_12650, partial [Leptolinea sp.]